MSIATACWVEAIDIQGIFFTISKIGMVMHAKKSFSGDALLKEMKVIRSIGLNKHVLLANVHLKKPQLKIVQRNVQNQNITYHIMLCFKSTTI